MSFIKKYDLQQRQLIYEDLMLKCENKFLAIVVELPQNNTHINLLVNKNCNICELLIYIRRKMQLPVISYYFFANKLDATYSILNNTYLIKDVIPNKDDKFRYLILQHQDAFGFNFFNK
jgi:hypothetical protein